MIIQRYYKELTFNIVKIATYYIILRIPQLKKYNLVINQKKGVLIFINTRDITNI